MGGAYEWGGMVSGVERRAGGKRVAGGCHSTVEGYTRRDVMDLDLSGKVVNSAGAPIARDAQ